MSARIYPSYQDTNTTAKGSIILSFGKGVGTTPLSYVNLAISGNTQAQYRLFRKSEGIYAINIPTLSSIPQLLIVSPIGSIESYTLYLREYTTDDQSANNGIIDTYITGYTGTSVAVNITPSIGINTYKYEYRINANAVAP